MNDNERRTGRTTRQMQEAPMGAVFVWCNDALTYPRLLAQRLCRGDLRIIGPSQLNERLRGYHTVVIIDHAADLTERQRDFLAAHYVEPKWQRSCS